MTDECLFCGAPAETGRDGDPLCPSCRAKRVGLQLIVTAILAVLVVALLQTCAAVVRLAS